MKVILLQNVPKIGQKGDIKDLKEGYVRNMLLPKGLAKIATDGAVKKLEIEHKIKEKSHDQKLAVVSDFFKQIKEGGLELKERINEKGHLFAQVGKKEIRNKIKEVYNFDLNESSLILETPIKEVGEHNIDLKFENLKSSFTLKVSSL